MLNRNGFNPWRHHYARRPCAKAPGPPDHQGLNCAIFERLQAQTIARIALLEAFKGNSITCRQDGLDNTIHRECESSAHGPLAYTLYIWSHLTFQERTHAPCACFFCVREHLFSTVQPDRASKPKCLLYMAGALARSFRRFRHFCTYQVWVAQSERSISSSWKCVMAHHHWYRRLECQLVGNIVQVLCLQWFLHEAHDPFS